MTLSNRFSLFNLPLLNSCNVSCISMLDIGGAHSLDAPWSLLDEQNFLTRYSYDPFHVSDKNRAIAASNLIFPFAVGAPEQVRTNFYECSIPSVSSCYSPNSYLNSKLVRWDGVSFKSDAELRRCSQVIEGIECVSIDSHFLPLDKIVNVFKIDTQGSEYNVLKGAREYIQKYSPVIIAETWTFERYKGAPLMHQVLDYSYSIGYVPVAMTLASSVYFASTQNVYSGHQTPSGYDLLLVPLERYISRLLIPEALIPACCILEAFGQRSLALHILEENKSVSPLFHNVISQMYANALYEHSLSPSQAQFFSLHY